MFLTAAVVMLRKDYRFLRTSCIHTHSSLCLIGKRRRRRGAADSPPSHMPGLFSEKRGPSFLSPSPLRGLCTLLLILPPNNTPFVVVLDNVFKDRHKTLNQTMWF